MAEFRMPALGADMEAGTLVAWLRKPGERLARGDVIAEVETDKGVIEVEVFEAGVLERYLVEPGQRVPVGTPLAVLSGDGAVAVLGSGDADGGGREAAAGAVTRDAPPATPATLAQAQREAGSGAALLEADVVRAQRAPSVVSVAEPAAQGGGASPRPPESAASPRAADAVASALRPPVLPLTPALRKRARELGVAPSRVLELALHSSTPSAQVADKQEAAAGRAVGRPDRPPSSPAARARALQLSLDIAQISGTGPDGAIVLADVERHAQQLKAAEPGGRVARSGQLAAPGGDQSVHDVASPASLTAAAEGLALGAGAPRSGRAAGLDALDPQARLRRAIGAAMARSKREIPHYYLSTTIDFGRAAEWLVARNQQTSVRDRILPAALLLKAAARAAAQLPDFNAVWRQGRLERAAEVNLGVAVALRGGGLIAPAIHRAHALGLPELMQRLADLVQRARAGALRSSELSDGTLTVTSLGERGVEAVFPIIYAPQTAIVGFGKIAERPWVIGSMVQARPLVTASLAADHRVTDGHLGARFLNLIDSLLQEPEQL